MRKSSTDWDAVFDDVRGQRLSQTEVAEKHGVNVNTLRSRISRERAKPGHGRLGTGPKLSVLPGSRPGSRQPRAQRGQRGRTGGHAATHETKVQRDARVAEQVRDRRDRRALESLDPITRQTLRRVVRRQVNMLEAGLLCPHCDGEDAQPLDVRSIRDLTVAVNNTMKTMPGLMTFEESLEEPEPELDLSSPEGQQQLAAHLNRSPRLVSLCDVRTLEVALEMARERQRREA